MEHNNEFDPINDHKNHDERRRRKQSWAVPVAALAILALVGVSTWGYYQNKELKDLQILMGNQYNRAFIDLSDYVDNVEVLLAKSLITSTPVKTSGMLEEVWRQANLAQTNIGQLPIAPPVLEKTSNFLTQVGDIAYAFNNKTLRGATLSDKEYESLKKLHGFAVSLQKNLQGIENQINTGKMVWGKGTSQGKQGTKQKTENPQTSQIENVDKNFQEYPSLIYDGPYSDHMLKTEPLGLVDKTVDEEEAKALVRKYLGKDNVREIKTLESMTGNGIDTYGFKVLYKDKPDSESAEVEITKKGGQLYWMLKNRPIEKHNLTMEEAKKAAMAFLERNGMKGMVDTYYQKDDGTSTICYAYSEDDTVIYPDLVKVKVALDNGEILGAECKGYLYNHRKRDLPEAKLTMEEARKQLNNKMEITGQGKAVIPTDFKTEKFCYEFKGKVDDRVFLVYINALTGEEEDILMLISTENGTLTM